MRHLLFLLLISSLMIITSCNNNAPEDVEPLDEEQLAADIATIDAYLSNEGIDALEHESGIRYVVNQEGTGDMPSLGDNIAVKFTSEILGGDTIGLDTIGFSIRLTENIIQAWRFMIPEMKEDGNITIYVPSGYAFGPTPIAGVPANSNLVYNLELLERIDNEDEQFVVELEIIDEFLNESGIQFREHTSGIRYVTVEEGSGERPLITDDILVHYKGTFLDGTQFDGTTNVPANFNLNGLIESWRLMITDMKVGGKVKFYSPSTYCYGTTGTGNGAILPNTTLVFEIELLEIL